MNFQVTEQEAPSCFAIQFRLIKLLLIILRDIPGKNMKANFEDDFIGNFNLASGKQQEHEV